MNEELVQRVIPIIDKMEEGIAKGVEVLQRECPLLVEDILQWNMCVSLICFGMGIFVLLMMLPYTKRMWKWGFDEERYDEDGAKIVVVAISVAHTCIGVGIATSSLTWIQIWIAPRLFLLEYVSELVGK